MIADHPYSLSIDGRHPGENGFRWSIAGSPSGKIASRETYATRREATIAGNGAVNRLAETWRLRKAAHSGP